MSRYTLVTNNITTLYITYNHRLPHNHIYPGVVHVLDHYPTSELHAEGSRCAATRQAAQGVMAFFGGVTLNPVGLMMLNGKKHDLNIV